MLVVTLISSAIYFCGRQGVRRLGAAAVDMCHVALGVADAYWEFRLKPWDMAAGVLVNCLFPSLESLYLS